MGLIIGNIIHVRDYFRPQWWSVSSTTAMILFGSLLTYGFMSDSFDGIIFKSFAFVLPFLVFIAFMATLSEMKTKLPYPSPVVTSLLAFGTIVFISIILWPITVPKIVNITSYENNRVSVIVEPHVINGFITIAVHNVTSKKWSLEKPQSVNQTAKTLDFTPQVTEGDNEFIPFYSATLRDYYQTIDKISAGNFEGCSHGNMVTFTVP